MNARSTLAPENRIAAQLRALNCSHRNFCAIANLSYGNFAAVMAGTRNLEAEEAERLLDLIQRMWTLRNEVGLPLDWSATEPISTALTLRMVAQIGSELFAENEEFAQAAMRATQRITQSATAVVNQ